jgi:hypothetical protein
VGIETTLSATTLAHALDHDPYALIVTEQRCFSGGAKKKLKLDLAEPKNASDLGEDDSIAYLHPHTAISPFSFLVAHLA